MVRSEEEIENFGFLHDSTLSTIVQSKTSLVAAFKGSKNSNSFAKGSGKQSKPSIVDKWHTLSAIILAVFWVPLKASNFSIEYEI